MILIDAFLTKKEALKRYGFFSRKQFSAWLYLLAIIAVCALRFFLVSYIDAGFETFFQIFNGTPISYNQFFYYSLSYLKWILLDISLSIMNTLLSLKMMDSISLKLKELFLDLYFKKSTFYGLKQVKEQQAVNFSQVIENDIDALVFTRVRRLSTLIEQSLLSAAALYSLWNYSQYLYLWGFSVPYLPLFALIYAGSFYTCSYYFSAILNQKMIEERQLDQDVMNTLTHVDHGAHSIALTKGGEYEKSILNALLKEKYLNKKLQQSLKSVIRGFELIHEKSVHLFTAVICLPSILAGNLTPSRLLNIGQHLISVMKFGSLYHASMDNAVISVATQRLDALTDTCKKWRVHASDQYNRQSDSSTVRISGPLVIQDRTVLPANKALVFSSQYNKISAPTGGGKSTIITTLAGLNPSYQAKIETPKNIVFIPQTPYILGGSATILDNCCYPNLINNKQFYYEKVKELMTKLAFKDYFIHRIDKNIWAEHCGKLTYANCSQTLSLGEKQCIALIRAILQKPEVLVIDEGTASMNADLKKAYYQLIKDQLPKTTIIYSDHHEDNLAQDSNAKHLTVRI